MVLDKNVTKYLYLGGEKIKASFSQSKTSGQLFFDVSVCASNKNELKTISDDAVEICSQTCNDFNEALDERTIKNIGYFMYEGESYTQQVSFLDKTDWRKTIHRCLENCVNTEGTTNYPKAVKSLVSAVSSTFPNWNTRITIEKYIDTLNVDYKTKITHLIETNPDYWVHPGKRIIVEPDIINSYYKDIFEYIKDMLADKRMLIWGSKTIPGGSQMEEE